jgi:hypothetical protein
MSTLTAAVAIAATARHQLLFAAKKEIYSLNVTQNVTMGDDR